MKHRTMLRVLTVILCLQTLLSGCIASYSLHSEQEFSAPPDLTAVCGYKWTHVEAFFRNENVISHEWAPPGNFGYGSLDPYVRGLPNSCPDSAEADAREAQLSAHYLEHVNKIAQISAASLSAFTLGLVPAPFTHYYAVCLQVITPDGVRRVGLTKGKLDSFENVWGSSDTRHHSGEQENRQTKEQLMRDLTLQAWHKIWLPTGSETKGVASCREALEAIAKR